MVKVLHVLSGIDSRSGGPAAALVGLTCAQAEFGLGVSVVVTYRAGDDLTHAQELRARGVNVVTIGPAFGPLMRHRDLFSSVSAQVAAADVVHIHAVWEEIQHVAALAARRLHKPYFVRPCGMLDPWSLAQSRWKKRAYMAWRLRSDLNHAAALHFTAELERDLTQRLELRAPALIEPNGLSLAEFAVLPPANSFRSRFPVLMGKPLILFLSRIHPKKGLDYLLPAFAAMHDTRAVLVIAGPDSDGYAKEVRELASRLGIVDRVLFVGMLHGAERVAALADADLFVLPSRQENFGIVVAEAMAARTAVIISDQVNIYREVLSAGAGGVVPLEVEPLTSEMNRWMGDDELRRAAGERGRRFAFAHYDWRAITARWVEHYRRAVAPS